MVGMDFPHPSSIAPHDVTPVGNWASRIKTENLHRPTTRVGKSRQFTTAGSSEMLNQRWPNRSAPTGGAVEQRRDGPSVFNGQSFQRVHRA